MRTTRRGWRGAASDSGDGLMQPVTDHFMHFIARLMDIYQYTIKGQMERKSLYCSHHDLVELLKGKFIRIFLAGPLDHLFQHLLVIVLVEYLVHLSDIVHSYVIFVISIVFLENTVNLFFVLILHRLVCHRLHKLEK